MPEQSTFDMSQLPHEFPGRFLEDADRFLDYCEAENVTLTKTTRLLGRKHLPALIWLMSIPAETANAYSAQEFYPYLHFLFTLALSGNLLEIDDDAATPKLKPTDRLGIYSRLSAPEKFCALLETFWVDTDWDFLSDNHRAPIPAVQTVFLELCKSEPGKKWNLANPKTEVGKLLHQETDGWQHFMRYFEWLGLYTCETDTERIQQWHRKNGYFAKSIAVTDFGKSMMPLLVYERNLQKWNIAWRRLSGDTDWRPGAPIDCMSSLGFTGEEEERLNRIEEHDQSGEPFHQPFSSLFPAGSLSSGLPRQQSFTQTGAYRFRVTLSRGVYRTLELPGIRTMDVLAHAILDAFHFDADHLYSFFMDSKPWSHQCIASPDDDFGHADASQMKISSTGLTEKQKFLFLYDYGDEWKFNVKVERIDGTNTSLFPPTVTEQKGTPPAQYPDWE